VVGFKDNMALVGIISTQLLHHQFVENFPKDHEKLENLRVIDYSSQPFSSAKVTKGHEEQNRF